MENKKYFAVKHSTSHRSNRSKEQTGDVVEGLLEYDRKHGGCLRNLSLELEPFANDYKVPPHLVHRLKLREASYLSCSLKGSNHHKEISDVLTINGLSPDAWAQTEEFTDRTAIDPIERLTLATSPSDYSMRAVDLLCPVGKGQRALIVAPPKSGKTMLLQRFAEGISTNHPEVDLMVLLVDERPEEVTDMKRTIKGEIFASSNDSDRESHVRIARLVLEYAKRKAEAGRDVVILLDSLTKMGRAFNAVQRSSGRTMSGGVDIRSLEIPKRIFGAACALEGAGSLTIIATALIDTNSRMDELIFQEFKGTGNMELVLNRDLANDRIYPAINIPETGTRHEELLFGRETDRYQSLRRLLNRMKPKQAMTLLLKAMQDYPTNRKLLAHLSRQEIEA